MNKELAEKLEEVGFPVPSLKVREGYMYYVSEVEEVYFPSLGELVEAACGDHYFSLMRAPMHAPIDKPWLCKGGEKMIGVLGATSEEAVANLWLALNIKSV